MRPMKGSTDPSAGPLGSIPGNLWLARDVAAIGNWILFLSLLAFLFTFTDSPSVAGSMFLLWLLPGFLLGPIVQRFVTWRNAPAFGITAQLMRATLVLPLFFLDESDGSQPVLILALVAGLTAPFAQAAHRALLHAVLPASQRAAAETALRTTWMVTSAVGPGLAYVLYGVSGLRSAATGVLVAQLIAAGLLLYSRPSRAVAGSGPEVRSVFAPVPLGLVDAFSRPAARLIAAVEVIAALVAGGLVVLEAAYTTNGLFVSIENLSVILATQGLGITVGGFFHYRLGRKFTPSTLVAAGLALVGGGEIGLGVSTGLVAGAGLACAIGAGIGIIGLSLSDLGSQAVNSEGLEKSGGRGTAILVEGAALLSIAAAGPLSEALTPRFALVLGGVLLIVLALYCFGSIPEPDPQDEPRGARD